MTESSEKSDELRQGYHGPALKLLQKFGAQVGNIIKVETTDGLVTNGLLIPRYEHADSEHIVLKLKSGYNFGLAVGSVKSIIVSEEQRPPRTHIQGGKKTGTREKHLLLLSTGGTIASRVDYRTGAVYPALTASDLYSAVPELDEIASVEPEVVFSIYSENMTPKDWEKLSERIISATESNPPDGIIVMIGTDTLAYASAALSFSLIGISVPIVFVGAQRSSDRPSSDAALNLLGAARFAVDSKLPGVYVAMHSSENDDFIAIHSGVRVRKNHTSRRDAFESIDVPHVAHVKGNDIVFVKPRREVEMPKGLELKSKFSEDAALLKSHPGLDFSILDYLTKERGVKGFILEGTGLGHVSSSLIKKISELRTRGIFVGMTSQCIWGRVDLNVYDTGRDLIAAGVIPLENMLSETAFVKLSWALANFDNVESVMLRNLAGEITERIPLASR